MKIEELEYQELTITVQGGPMTTPKIVTPSEEK